MKTNQEQYLLQTKSRYFLRPEQLEHFTYTTELYT